MRGGEREGTGSPKGFFGRQPTGSGVTIDEAIAILGARLKWCNGKIDLYEGEDEQMKYLDNLSRLAGALVQAYRLRGIEVSDDQDLARIFEEIARRKHEKKAIRIFVSEGL